MRRGRNHLRREKTDSRTVQRIDGLDVHAFRSDDFRSGLRACNPRLPSRSRHHSRVMLRCRSLAEGVGDGAGIAT